MHPLYRKADQLSQGTIGSAIEVHRLKGPGLIESAGSLAPSVVSPKWLVFCCHQVGLWRGARREHPPKWGCDRRATKPQANLGATRRAAGLFGPGFVARSLQIHFGICSSLAPRLDRKSLAAKHQPFRRHNTSATRSVTENRGALPEVSAIAPPGRS